ncbi:MAG: FprA family A-type flavoprotein [Kiritimatiellaeota bacterium]|nr:FprA family A-type flavoprotein [Kiritimatiellota bacterium]
MMNQQLANGVFWVGAVDWHVRDFHGYVTKRGSTYNAYLAKGSDAAAVIDSVKAPFAGAQTAQVLARAGCGEVAWLVCNHAEPDHSGGLPALVAAFPCASVVCNAKCRDALSRHYDTAAWRFHVVKDGDTLSLGGRTLQFFDTPMVHWPESMATWLQEDKILFSMDIFGQHYASSARFDDEADMAEVMREAKTYYANIVLPYARPVQAALAKLGGLDIKTAAPSHGVIWRSRLADITAAYRDWCVSRPARKVVVVFSTMWQSTRLMADTIADAAASRGVTVKVMDTRTASNTDIITEVMDCACLAAGSPTLNQSLMPSMAATLAHVAGLRPAGKFGVAFGSHGWAGKGAEEVGRRLYEMGVTMLQEPLRCQFVPDAETLARCHEAGVALAEKALETVPSY